MNKDKLAFCLECDSDVNYFTKPGVRSVTVKGIPVSFNSIEAYCSKCGTPIFAYEVERINQIRCFDEYKKKKGLLTSGEIIAIRDKYNLSQTDLANAIMVGKKNIARYETGKIQDKCIDLLIRMLDQHPEWFGIKIQVPNKQTLKAFKEVEKVLSGKKKTKKYSSAEELRKDLKL